MLHRGETARDCMRRLKTAGGSEATSELERVIEACDVLLRAGIADIYRSCSQSHYHCVANFNAVGIGRKY